MTHFKISNIQIGDAFELVRQFSDTDVKLFSELSGDINPVHLDESYAKETIFGQRIVHGALLTSIFSTIFANHLPGPGCIYLKSENKFLKPVYLNQPITFRAEIINIVVEKKRVIFKTIAKADQQEIIVGTAELYIPE
ncbi:MaoC family dehydratase [Acinetobacter haemolyticus]|uniref:MaoC family dehydratase n=1 Tax=Acinetobacter haemolyticus TaxID=29430 RepID=A0A4P7B1B9_ACIHA|nr:MaoC family dehydratase [Acinetobacter haemolyticus]QBQ15292.1 MaoC family dehydratase [Acinetobacter haemolyticus]